MGARRAFAPLPALRPVFAPPPAVVAAATQDVVC
jgi:hypothetical protein